MTCLMGLGRYDKKEVVGVDAPTTNIIDLDRRSTMNPHSKRAPLTTQSVPKPYSGFFSPRLVQNQHNESKIDGIYRVKSEITLGLISLYNSIEESEFSYLNSISDKGLQGNAVRSRYGRGIVEECPKWHTAWHKIYLGVHCSVFAIRADNNLGDCLRAGDVAVKLVGDAQVVLAGDFEGVAKPRHDDVQGVFHRQFGFPAFAQSVEGVVVDDASLFNDHFDLEIEVVLVDGVAWSVGASGGIVIPLAEQLGQSGWEFTGFDGCDSGPVLCGRALHAGVDHDLVFVPKDIAPLQFAGFVPTKPNPSTKCKQGAIGIVWAGVQKVSHVFGGDFCPVAVGAWSIAFQALERVAGNLLTFDGGIEDGLHRSNVLADGGFAGWIGGVFVVQAQLARCQRHAPISGVVSGYFVKPGIVVEKPAQVLAGNLVEQSSGFSESGNLLGMGVEPCKQPRRIGSVRELTSREVGGKLTAGGLSLPPGEFGLGTERFPDSLFTIPRREPSGEPVVAVGFEADVDSSHTGKMASDPPAVKRRARYASILLMYEFYCSGKTLEEIGVQFGRTRQSVFEIFKRYGLKCRSKKLLPFIEFRGLKYTVDKNGYYRCTVGRIKTKFLHQEVWRSHNGEIPNGYDIHHRDENKQNNCIENLECLSKADHTRLYSPHNNQFTRGFQRRGFASKNCAYCGKFLVPNRDGDRKETPSAFAKRLTCNPQCGGKLRAAKGATCR